MNLPNQAFRNGRATAEIIRDRLEGIPVIQEFLGILRIDARRPFAREQLFGLVEGQVSALNVRRSPPPKIHGYARFG